MDIHLHVHFPDLAEIKGMFGLSVPTVKAGASAPVAAVADTLLPVTQTPAAEKVPAKKATAKAPTADTAAAEQAEIDGDTNTGCIIMIKRVAAMDGKNADGTDKATGLKKATAIIQSFGGVKVSELPKEKWAPFIQECKTTLEGTAEEAATDVKQLF